MLRLVVFEVEIERDERPIAVVTVPQRLLYDGPNALEEILIHGRLIAVGRFPVGDNRPAAPGLGIGMPGQILLDGQWSARRKSTIDAVAPPFEVGITVVRIHDRARTRMRLLCHKRRRADQESQQTLNPLKASVFAIPQENLCTADY